VPRAGSRRSYGDLRPNRFQAWVIARARSMPDSWLGRRLAFTLRRLVRSGRRKPFDVTVFGLKMRLYPHFNVAEARLLFTPQYFDPKERAFLASLARPGFVFVDVGANVGGYSMFVASLKLPGSRILSIEPQPDVFDRLTYNLSLNPGLPVKAIACALSDRDGEMTLFLNPRNQGQSSVKVLAWDDDRGPSVAVPCRTLAGLLTSERIDAIDALKLDVEGAEDLILVPFFEQAPKSVWPRAIVIENERSRWKIDCIELCQEHGYRLIGETRLNAMLLRADVATPSR
jgi:FkbM family methyltransferase